MNIGRHIHRQFKVILENIDDFDLDLVFLF